MNRILEKLFRWEWRNPPLKNNKNGIADVGTLMNCKIGNGFVGGGALDAPHEEKNKNMRRLGSDTKCLREKNETFRLGHQMSQDENDIEFYERKFDFSWRKLMKKKLLVMMVMLITMLIVGGSSVYATPTDDKKLTNLKVGDWVDYQSVQGETTGWRVWAIEGDNVVIKPVDAVGKLMLGQWGESLQKCFEDWKNSESIINEACQAYTNAELGITASNIRSMKIEDIEDKISNLNSIKTNYGAGQTYAYGNTVEYASGQFGVKYNGTKNEILTSLETASSTNKITVQSDYWVGAPTWKTIPESDSTTYGDLIGGSEQWLASPCVRTYSDYAYFYVRYVYSGYVYTGSLFLSIGYPDSRSYGLAPLVSLDANKIHIADDNTGDGTSKANAYKISNHSWTTSYYNYGSGHYTSYCTTCGARAGETGHSYSAGSCVSLKTCVCGATNGYGPHSHTQACPTCGKANIKCSLCGNIKDHVCDTTPPTASISVSPTITNGNTVRVTVTASDTQSGLGTIQINGYYGNAWVSTHTTGTTVDAGNGTYYADFTLSNVVNTSTGATNQGDGTYSFDAYVYDNAGNQMNPGKVQVIKDTVAPTVTLSSSSVYVEDTVTITLADATSGLAGYAVTTSNSTPTSWNTASASQTYTPSAPGTYYVWAKDKSGNTTVKVLTVIAKNYTDGTNTYITLAEAFSNASSGSTITVLNDVTDASNPTLVSGKTMTLDTNGKTITITQISNNGTLTITDDGAIKGKISNAGTLTIDEGSSVEISTTRTAAISSSGTLNINGTPTISSNAQCIEITAGTANITGGTITGNYGIKSYGTLNISGGEIVSSNPAIEVDDGQVTISGTANINSTGSAGIDAYEGSTVNITGGVITGGGAGSIVSDAIINITGGTLNGTVMNYGPGVITLGTNDSNVSDATPVINGYEYGYYGNSGSVLNFYDGVIKGTENALELETDDSVAPVVNVPTKYEIATSSDDTYEIATLILSKVPNYKVGEIYYETLAEAYAACDATDTITVIAEEDFTDDSALTIVSGKNITLDFAESDVTINRENIVINVNQGATFTLKGSGTINGTGVVINSKGTFYLNENVAITSTVNNQTYKQEQTVCIDGTGNAHITGGSISNTATGNNAYALTNFGTGTIYISGGEIFGNCARVVSNESTGKIEISGGNIHGNSNMNGSFGVVAASSGEIIITGGTITSYGRNIPAVYSSSSANIKILGGEIVTTGIYVLTVNGTQKNIQIGNDDGNVSTTTPILRNDGGYYFFAGGAYFYDGIILVKGTANPTVPKSVGLPDGYAIANGSTTIGGEQYTTAYLKKAVTLVTVPEASYQYTGSAITPTVTAKHKDTVLVKDTDYTVTYTNNINIGTATVTVTGIGDYTGTATTTFEITKATGSISYITSDKKLTNLKVGDWVDYQSVKGETTGWRVWAIEEDKVIIKPADAVGSLTLGSSSDINSSFLDWKNSETIINSACKEYTNNDLKITVNDIRSLAIEDLEGKSSVLKPNSFSTQTYTSGKFGAKFDGITNKVLLELETATTSKKITVQNDYYGGTPTWNYVSASSNTTYGDLIGSNWQWLASQCIYAYQSGANFDAWTVKSDAVDARYLFYSGGNTYSTDYGLAPLVTLDANKIQIANDNTGNGTSKASAYKISLADTKVEKTFGDSEFTQELINTGDGEVAYASSNTSVATVNATTGEVTIVGAGETTITATVADSANYAYATKTASYELTVNKKAPTLTVSNKSVKIDETIDVTFEYEGDGTTLNVTSGSTSIAEITSSVLNTKTIKVKGITRGSTTVDVTITGGTNYKDITETFIVTVNDTNIEITTQPANQTIFKDQNATFSVVAEGSNLTYQWYKAEDGASSGTAIDGATNSIYTISSATMAMNGTYYYCKVTNSAGSLTSNRAKLTVNKLEGNIAYIASDKKLTNLKVGDWVDYQSVKGETTGWRVWAIEGDKVIIKPADAVGSLKLGQSGNIQKSFDDWKNAVSIINNACKAYTNNDLQITADDIRSLTLEDLEGKSSVIKPSSFSIKTYASGDYFGAEYDGTKNVILDDFKSAPVTVQIDYYGGAPTWNNIPGSYSITYGNLIGSSEQWLPSPRVLATTDFTNFGVSYVYSGYIHDHGMFSTNGDAYDRVHGLAPLVTLDANKIQIANDNTGNGTSKANAYKISLADTKVEKTYGDSAFTQPLTKIGDGTVTYASSNTDVATINATTGEVTIVGAGTATIIATVADGVTYTYPVNTASYELTVNKKAPTLTVNPTSLSIILGNTATAAITYDGDGLLSAPSNATGIATATVANKVVTVTTVGGGNATITVTAAEGANYLGATATIAITVYANPTTPTITVANVDGSVASNTWSTKDLSITIGGSTLGGSEASVGYKYSYDGSTWYVYNGVIAYTTETKDAVIYAKAYNKLTESAESDTVSYNIKLDKTAPTITLGSSSITYGTTTTITLSDSGAGVGGYAVTSSTTVPTSWTNYSSAVTWGSSMSAGTYYVHAKDNVGNTTYKIVTVNAKSVNDLTVSLGTSTYTYDNTAKTPTVTVKDGEEPLAKDTDYTVAYTNNTNAGTATVTITGKGNYSGTKDVTFTINKALPTLTVNPTSINIVAGNKATSNVTYNGDGTLSVSSSATGVATATVTDKVVTVTGVSAGTATITVSATEGDNYLANTATINVTVTAKNYSVGSTYFTTLAQAYASITGTSGTIKVEADCTDASELVIASGKDITIDTSTHTINLGETEIQNNGTLYIKGTGTITGSGTSVIANTGTVVIGTKDGEISKTTPVIKGDAYGISSSGSIKFYDGIIEGKTAPINGTVTDKEATYRVVNGTDGEYVTAYLEQSPAPISLNPRNVTVEKGDTTTANIIYGGDGAVTLTSENSNIATATIADGIITITGVNVGSTNILINIADGSDYLASTASIKVVVEENYEAEGEIILDRSKPVVTLQKDKIDYGQSVTINITDETSGIYGWQVTENTTVPTTGWTEIETTLSKELTYTPTAPGTYYIWARDMAENISEYKTLVVRNIDIIADINGYTGVYDKSAHGITIDITEPEGQVTIKYGTESGVYNLDSNPTYTDIGEYTVYYQMSAFGYNTKTGSAVVKITPKDVAELTVASIPDQTYTGSEIKPTPTVKYGETSLVADSDVTYSYKSNINAGTATVTITGKGNYTGTKDVTFTIIKALPTLTVNPTSINMVAGNKATSNVTYNGDGVLDVSSSATGVATAGIANKVVTITGVSAGTAVITVSATEGDNYLANTTTINVIVRVANYYDDKGINYTTLDEAFNNAETGSVIKPYYDMEESATATVPAGKTIVLDLDGKKITAPREESCTLIVNNGTLELKDSGTDGKIRLDSNYVEDINVSTIPGIEKKMVVNNGTLTVSSGTYTSRADDGKVVVIESNGVTNVTGGVISATNNGDQGYSRAIVTNGGTLNVSEGTISASANSIYNCYAIVNEGVSATDINITGGEISGDRGAIYIAKRDNTCVDNNTTLSISGDTVIESSKGYGIYNNFSVNDIEITGGSIHAGIDGIYNEASKVIVGTKDGSVLTSSPIIAGEVRGITSVKGIELYDGKLEGKSKSVEGTVVAKENGYEVYNSSEPNGDEYYETYLKKVSELEVSVETLELIAQGDDGTITYIYEGDGIITAISSDESIATVVVNETDHTITVTPIKAGNVEITVIAPDTDTYIGSEISIEVSIEPAGFEITLDTEIYTYDGNPCMPEITVVANGEELVEGEDYEIEYVDNVNAGTATVIVRGIGDYEGSTNEVIFRINKAQVNVPTGKELLYTGSMQTGVDEGDLYRLLNNTGVDVGEYTATAILKDKINYEWAETESSDDYEVSWKIAGKLMTLDAISIESISDKQYTGSAITPKPTVTDVELHKTLVEGTDFTYSYENNVEVGVATVIITGKEIYAGTLDTTFNILPSNYSITKDGVTTYFETLAQAVNSISVDGVTIKLLTDNYTDTSEVVIDKQIILDTNGKTLIKKDHSIDVDSTGTLKVIGAGTVTASNVDTITNSGKVYIETANTKIENTATSTYCAIITSGTVNVSDGIVESNGSSAIKVISSGSVNVSGNAKVVGNGGSAITSESTKANAINITGGRIEATGKAINNTANTVITLGTKDGNITKNVPVIISSGDVAVYSAGGINFYDGLLLSENSSNVFTGEVIDTEANCTVVKEDCVYEATSYHSAFAKQEGKLDIEAEDIKLYAPGDDGVITYTYVGNGDISVISSNNEIATVTIDEANHKITIHPVKEGEVIITVSSGETDTCTADSKEIAVKVICSEMDVTLSETSYDYDGTERKPDVTVKTGEGKELVEGVDYTVSYEDNTNAGIATVVVTGIGDYEGINETTTFTINKIVVTVPTGRELVYNGSIQVGVDAGELYDISGNSAIKIGEYTAIAKLKDTFNYEWNTAKDDNADKQISWKILGKVISIENIEVENVEDQTYTGNEIKPTPVVKDIALDAILVNGLDFKYTYTNNINAGTATITITGLGNYTGSIEVTFDILPIKVEVPVGKTLTYNGLEQTGVEPNTLYTLTNNKKTNAGEYLAIARLISQVNYEWVTGGSDDKEIAWKIFAKDLRDVTVGNISDYTYNGKAIKPTPAVIDEERGTSLTVGTDFEYSYSDNIDAGTATLTITFKNNYEGKKEFKFVINEKEVEVVWQNTELRYDGTERVPTATVNSGVTGETINLEVTGSGKSDVGTGYEATTRIASVTGGREKASNYLLTNTKVSYSILADNYFVGGLYYHTLAEAIEAADSEDTIEVMNNVTDESEEIAIPSGKDITIETNGYVVSIPDGKAIEVTAGGALTIAGTGTISGKGESEAIPVINSLGEVKIDGAKVVNTNPSGYAIIVSGTGELDLSSGTVNGKVKAKDSSKINVTGGTIMSSSNDKTVTLVDNASLDISGGTISANIGGTAIDTSSTNKVTISGDARVTGANTGIRVTNGDVIITGGTVASEEGYAIANNNGRVVIGKDDDDVSQLSPVIRGNKAAYVSYTNDAEIEVYDGVLQSKSNCIVYVSNDGTVNINNRTPGIYIAEGMEIESAEGYQLSSMKSLVEGLTYNIAFLRAEQLPRISGPKDVTVIRGEEAVFEVEATNGIPNVYTYKWYVSHNNGSTWEVILGEEEASYTIPFTTLDMNGNLYRVVVSNGLTEDVTSRAAKLIVKDSKDDNGPVDMVPMGRFTFVNGEKISKYKGNDVTELKLVIKTVSELATLTLNNVNIPVDGSDETNVNGNAIVVIEDKIAVRNSKDEIAEYAYTYKVYAKENGNFVAKFSDSKGYSSSATQTIEVFKNALSVAYAIQEPTIYQKYSVVTFTANRNVKFVEPAEYAESMNKLGKGEYVNKYTFNVYTELPETTFAFEDSSGYVATVTLSVNDSSIKYLRFTNDAQDIDSITLEEAFTKAQNMENEIEANEKQGVQSRYGTTARQTDMFLSRARDIGAADILARASVTKAYDQVLPKEITGSGAESVYGLVGNGNTYVAGYRNSVENKLTEATRQYVDKLPTSLNLYKGLLDTSSIVIDENREDTSFRATIIVK